MKISLDPRRARLGTIGAVLWLGGCFSPVPVVVDIDASDGPQWSQGFRLGHELAPFGEDIEATIELDASHVAAEDEVFLRIGEAIRIDRDGLSGPGFVDLDFDLRYAALALRVESTSIPTLRIGGSFGLGWHDLEIRARSGAARASDSLDSIGPAIGAHLEWEPVDWGSLRLDAVETPGFGASRLTNLLWVQTGADLHPFTHRSFVPSLFLGWRWTRYEADNSNALDVFDSDNSGIDLRVSGPVMELGLRF